jgi:hypothetical protein
LVHIWCTVVAQTFMASRVVSSFFIATSRVRSEPLDRLMKVPGFGEPLHHSW